MKATITQRERLTVAELVRDAQHRLAGVEDLERRIAVLLGLEPGEDREAITDATGGALTVDGLLAQLHIGVDDPAA